MADLEATFGLDYSQFRRAAADVKGIGTRTEREVSRGFAQGSAALNNYLKSFTGIGLGAGAAYTMIRQAGQAVERYAKDFQDAGAALQEAKRGQREFGQGIGRDLIPVYTEFHGLLSDSLRGLDRLRGFGVNMVADLGGALFGRGESSSAVDAARLGAEESQKAMAAAIVEAKEQSKRRAEMAEDEKRRQAELSADREWMAQRESKFQAEEAEATLKRNLEINQAIADRVGMTEAAARHIADLERQIARLAVDNDTNLTPLQRRMRQDRIDAGAEFRTSELLQQARERRDLAVKSSEEETRRYVEEQRVEALRLSGHQTAADLLEMELDAAERRRAIEEDINLTIADRQRLSEEIARTADQSALALVNAKIGDVSDRIAGRASGANYRVLASGLGAAAAFAFGPPGSPGNQNQESQRLQVELKNLNQKQVELLERIERKTGGAGRYGP